MESDSRLIYIFFPVFPILTLAEGRGCCCSWNTGKLTLKSCYLMKTSPRGKQFMTQQAVQKAGVKMPVRHEEPLVDRGLKVTPLTIRHLSSTNLVLLHCTAVRNHADIFHVVGCSPEKYLSSWRFDWSNPFSLLRSIYSPSIWPTIQKTCTAFKIPVCWVSSSRLN